MKILFFIESLHAGGKERRLVELIKGLSKDKSTKMEIVLTKELIHYQDIYSTNIKIYYTLRDVKKKDPRIFYKFYKITKEFKPDIIHVWGNLAAIYAIPAKVFLRIPMINSQVSDAPNIFSNSILSHKISFPFSNKIIANSYAGLKAYKAPKKKSIVIYNGFDFNRISNLEDKDLIRKKFKIKTKYVVGMVASLSDKKDYTTYIKAANIVLNREKNVTFLCIGSGDDSKYLEKVERGNIGKILFLGKQKNVESIMNICDIGVLSTFTEGISNALMEFSALGIPVITNFGGGNVELVQQGKTGYLVNTSSPNEFAEKIEILLNDKKNRLKFGNNGKKRIANDFSIEAMVESFKKAYNEFLINKRY